MTNLVSEVSVANVSRKRGISGRTLCNGSDIRELVRASHNCVGTRPSMRKITRQSMLKSLHIVDAKQNTHREREKKRHKECLYS